MSFYIIAQIQIHDRTEYSIYEAGFMDIFSRFDGKILSVDENPDVLEGSWRFTRTVLAEFPSKADAMAWYSSEEYQVLAQHRISASDGNIVSIQGLGESDA